MKHLKLCLIKKYKSEEFADKHPQNIATSLEIKREKDIPRSLGNCWWFLNCTNIPHNLPNFITELKLSEVTVEHWLND